MDEIVKFDFVSDKMQSIIKVIGVGGGGCNAVGNMYKEGIKGVSLAVCNTDSQALSTSQVPVKLMLGEGLGAGGDPELGRTEAEKNLEDIEKLMNDGTKMVFVTASMGGGTGTGAAPVVAKVSRRMGILTVGVVTLPFLFEKKQQILKALRGVDEMRNNVDALLIINNERLTEIYGDSDISFREAFSKADNVLKDAVKAIAELITVYSEGDINVDLRDVEATIRNGGGAIMAIGHASGNNRIANAIIDALDSPLLYGRDIGKAKRILLNIYDGQQRPITVRELREINDFFETLDPDIKTIFGTTLDSTLGEDVRVTILASGIDEEPVEGDDEFVEKDDAYYRQLMKKLYRPIIKPLEQPLPEPGFTVKIAPEPEVAAVEATTEETNNKSRNAPIEPTFKEKLKSWLVQMVEDESF